MNAIIKELNNLLESAIRSGSEEQQRWYMSLLWDAVSVKCVRAVDVLDENQIDYIRHVIKPQRNACFRNAHMLTEAFPEILYVEGFYMVPEFYDHAFNKIGDKYIDITIEFALEENPRKFKYLSCGEYGLESIMEAAKQTRQYGNVYRHFYEENQTIK